MKYPAVKLTAESGQSLDASVVFMWDREACERADGPTFRTMAAAMMNAVPQASRVALICTKAGQMLLILNTAHQWFDASGKAIGVRLS